MEILQSPNKLQMEAVRNNLNEDESRMSNNIDLFEKWIKSQAHLPQNYDKNTIPIFLRGCKHDMTKTKKKFETYFALKEYVEELLIRDPTSDCIRNLTKVVNIVILPRLTQDGSRVLVFKLADTDVSKFNIKDSLSYLAMTYDIRFTEEKPHTGEIFVFDAQGFTPAHATKFVSTLLKKCFLLVRKAYPIRITHIHVINCPGFVSKMIDVLKPYMQNSIQNRFIIHKNSDTLLNHLPEDVLPSDLGGSDQNLQVLTEKWYKTILDHTEWFKKQKDVKCTGPVSENIQKFCDFGDNFGLDGSFRKLEID